MGGGNDNNMSQRSTASTEPEATRGVVADAVIGDCGSTDSVVEEDLGTRMHFPVFGRFCDDDEVQFVGSRDASGQVFQPFEIEAVSEDDKLSDENHDDRPIQSRVDNEWCHVIKAEDLQPGYQVYVYRGLIQHHGIVVRVEADPSETMIVHFDSGCDGVEAVTLPIFSKGGTLRRAHYSASIWASGIDLGASYHDAADDPQIIVKRANEAAKFCDGKAGWSGYNVLTNNCETFATWCSTGRRCAMSRQARRAVVGLGVGTAMVIGASAASSAGGLATAAGVVVKSAPRGFCGMKRAIAVVNTVAAGTMATVLANEAADHISKRVTGKRGNRREAETAVDI